MASLANINVALANNLLTLGLFEQNYGGFFTALLAPSLGDAGFVECQLNGADDQAIAMQSYLASHADNRFPVGSGKTAMDALEALNTLLGQVSQTDFFDWVRDVRQAYEYMQEARRKYGTTAFMSLAAEAGELKAVN